MSKAMNMPRCFTMSSDSCNRDTATNSEYIVRVQREL